jgi:cytidine deaminase
MRELESEDRKLVTLARSSQARSAAAEGAAVRDTDGRTYAGAAVDLPSLRLSALQVAVAMAASSGATGLEAAAVVRLDGSPGEAGVDAVRDLGGAGVPVLVADPAGSVRSVLTT